MARKIVQFQYDAVNDTFTVLCDDGTLRCRKFTLTEDARSASEVGRATSDLERRALEACESLYSDYKDSLADLTKSARNACAVGRESLAAKKPKGPWTQSTVDTNEARHDDGRCVLFFSADGVRDRAACAAFVAEQNEREASRV